MLLYLIYHILIYTVWFYIYEADFHKLRMKNNFITLIVTRIIIITLYSTYPNNILNALHILNHLIFTTIMIPILRMKIEAQGD